MDKAKRVRISQHMLQHIMKLMPALRIVRSPFLELTYLVNMFIARMQLFVNRKFFTPLRRLSGSHRLLILFLLRSFVTSVTLSPRKN